MTGFGDPLLCDCGLDCLEQEEILQPETKDWLELELELSKLQGHFLNKDKVAKLYCLKKLKSLEKKHKWPESLQKSLSSLLEELGQENNSDKELILCHLRFLVEKNSMHTLPEAGYWAFETLLKKLDEYEKNLKQKTHLDSFDRLISFLDNYHWDKEIRLSIERLKDIQNNPDVQNQLQKIRKLLKAKRKLPSF